MIYQIYLQIDQIDDLDPYLPTRYAMQDLYGTAPTQRRHVLIDHVDYTAPTLKRYELYQVDHTDHTDHADHTRSYRSGIYLYGLRYLNHELGIDDL